MELQSTAMCAKARLAFQGKTIGNLDFPTVLGYRVKTSHINSFLSSYDFNGVLPTRPT